MEFKSFQMDSVRGNMGQEWSRKVSAEVKEEYLTPDTSGLFHTSLLKR